jgi:hypothetical protein
MSSLFNEDHRKLQDRFDSRRLADRLEQTTVFAQVRGRNKRFIESRDMFFLATVDGNGRPTVSYKGGLLQGRCTILNVAVKPSRPTGSGRQQC